MNFGELFSNVSHKSKEVYHVIFNTLKPLIIEKIINFLNNRRIHHTGRPISTDFNKFLDALYFISESGSQFKYVKDVTGISKGTFYRYLKLVSENHMIQDVYDQLIQKYPLDDLLISDTFTVKSMNGSQGLGRNPTDRGRKGLKVSIISNTNRVVRAVKIGSANRHDSKLLIETINQIPQPTHPVTCLCDSGYVGRQLRNDCQNKNFRLVVKPRKTTKVGKMSHVLLKIDAELLRKKRNQIELLNGQIRRFRGLMIKWVRHIEIYACFLYVAILCITCHQLFTS